MDGQWYMGTVAEAAPDGTYGIDWEDGSFSHGLPSSQLRPQGGAPRRSGDSYSATGHRRSSAEYSYGPTTTQLPTGADDYSYGKKEGSAYSYSYSSMGTAAGAEAAAAQGQGIGVVSPPRSHASPERLLPSSLGNPLQGQLPASPTRQPAVGDAVQVLWSDGGGEPSWHNATVHSVDPAAGLGTVVWEDGTHTGNCSFEHIRHRS